MNTSDKEQYVFNQFKKLNQLYLARVDPQNTVKKRLSPATRNAMQHGIMPATIEHVEEHEIGLIFPETEYNRFMKDWGKYIDLMYVCKHNENVKNEFEKVMLMVQLLK